MRGWRAFLKKEICEAVRTYKVLIFGAVFFILGVTGPLTAKYMPDLMEAFLPEGMILNLAPPRALDSWLQFFKNVPQMGLVVTIILLSGMMASEWSKGTLVLVLTKGLDRKSVILAKFTTATLLWSGAYWFSFGISYGYTRFFWEEKTPHVGEAVGLLWFFGEMLIAVTLLGGVLFKNSYGPLLLTAIVVVILILINILPDAAKYNPWMLASGSVGLLEGSIKPSEFMVPGVLTGVMTLGALLGAMLIFDRKQV